jgi:hypothetical protein
VATPIGSADHAPDEILKCIKKIEKAKEDLDSTITPIGREFILVKVGQPKDFQSRNSQTRLQCMILELRHRDETRMP